MSRLFLKTFLVLILTCAGVVPAYVYAKDSVVGEATLSAQSLKKKSNSKQKATAATEQPPPKAEHTVEAYPTVPTLVDPKEKKTVGYDKGFFIRSADDKYRLVINMYGQFQFEYEREGGENTFGFRIRRVRLSLSGHLATEKLGYKIQLDFAKFKDSLLLEYYLDYKPTEAFTLRGGQQPIPWIRQHIISSSEQQFVERSLASNEFLNQSVLDTDGDGTADKTIRDGYDIGIVAQGKPFNKKMEYNVGFFNGSGANSLNLNNNFLYTGRAVYNIMGNYGYEEGDYAHSDKPQIFLGSSGNYNLRDFTSQKVTQLGAETGLKYKGFSAAGEFFYRNTSPGNTSQTGNSNDYGYYAQVGYFAVPKRLEVAARASQVFFEGFQNDKAEFQLGLTGYPMKNKILKFQTDYSVLPENTVDGVETSQRFRLQMQAKF